eukprot:9441223-Ditylum_brightwellii.AAC.1
MGKNSTTQQQRTPIMPTNISLNIKIGKNVWLATDDSTKRQYRVLQWVVANDSFRLWEGKG